MKRGKYKLGVRLGNGTVFFTVEDLDFGGGEHQIPVEGLKIDAGQTHISFNDELPVRFDKNVTEEWKEQWLDSPFREKLEPEDESDDPTQEEEKEKR